jgi:hypothetical protein
MQTMHFLPGVAKQPNLELKTRPKPVLGSLLLAFALPAQANACTTGRCMHVLHAMPVTSLADAAWALKFQVCLVHTFTPATLPLNSYS